LELRASSVRPEEAREGLVWRVKHPLGNAWLEAPGLQLLHGPEGQTALRAEQAARQAKAKAAVAVVRLFGETPSGAARGFLGEYKRVAGSNINGHPFFSKKDDSRLALWHALDGNWFGGLADIMQGQFGHARGMLRIATTDASRVPPELGAATWEVWDVGEEAWKMAPKLKMVAAATRTKGIHDEV